MEKEDEILRRYGGRVGYSEAELEKFREGGHRVRQVRRLSQAAGLYTIEAEVVKSRHCNTGYKLGDRFIIDVDGNFFQQALPKTNVCLSRLSIEHSCGPYQ